MKSIKIAMKGCSYYKQNKCSMKTCPHKIKHIKRKSCDYTCRCIKGCPACLPAEKNNKYNITLNILKEYYTDDTRSRSLPNFAAWCSFKRSQK